jgi:nitroreductase
MDFYEIITTRRAIRKYKSDPIPEEVLEKLYKALQAAPSGNNREPYHFIFVTDSKTLKDIAAKACNQEFLLEPPIIVVPCCEQGKAFDTAIALDHMVLAATKEGLGTCWVGWFDKGIVKDILGIERHLEVPVLIPVGYPDESPPAKTRKPVEELIVKR